MPDFRAETTFLVRFCDINSAAQVLPMVSTPRRLRLHVITHSALMQRTVMCKKSEETLKSKPATRDVGITPGIPGRIDSQTFRIYKGLKEDTEIAGREESRALTKWLLTFSGGAAVFSWTLFQDIALRGESICVLSIYLAWPLLIAGIMSGIVSFWVSKRAHEEYVKILDATVEEARGRPAGGFSRAVAAKRDDCGWVKWIDRFDGASLVCFLLGIICLSVFAYSNVPRSPRGTTETKQTQMETVWRREVFFGVRTTKEH